MTHLWRVCAMFMLPLAYGQALGAENTLPLLVATPTTGGQIYGVPASSLPYLVLFPFLPALLLSFTAFTRIAVVLFLLRHGLGSPTAPPNLVLAGLALLLTWFVMSPALEKIHVQAYTPFVSGQIELEEATDRAAAPLKAFMLRQTRQEDLSLFTAESNTPNPVFDNARKPDAPKGADPHTIFHGLQPVESRSPLGLRAEARAESYAPQGDSDPLRAEARAESYATTVPFKALAPAFLTSELKTAFQIGFMVVLPFLVIDLVVASVLTALGMVMLPPQLVSLPLKLLLFVMANGWHLLVGSLIGSF
jgi:flagellar biosynthetic protein FliP